MSEEIKDKQQLKKERMGTAGGQALIEGVMMNGPEGIAVAVRHVKDGKIKVVPKNATRPGDKSAFFRLPFIRGLANFIFSMKLGYSCLMQSAELSGSLEADIPENEKSKTDKWLEKHLGPKLMSVMSGIAMVLGFLLAFGLFVWLPAYVVKLADVKLFGSVLTKYSLKPLIEGIIRIVIFVIYMAVVSSMKDMHRVFQYHGAEHKTIFCYEAGEELTVENVKKFKRFHPRCGTSFIFVILIISILLSSLLAVILNQFEAGSVIIQTPVLWSLIKILILPIIVGAGYEYIRYAGRHENTCTKIFSAPGLWMQRITTKEPDDSMIEVGIASMKAAAFGDYGTDEEGSPDETEQDGKKEDREKDVK